jgi:RNA ligase (TIGR02306 family)
MMSKFTVEVVRISEIKMHPDADALEIAMVEGSMWQTIVAKGQYHAGDTALFVPVEALLSVELSDQWNVTRHLSKQRVRAARLRGQMSYGFLTDPPRHAPVGTDFAEELGVVKYEPPTPLDAGDMDVALSTSIFPMYTDIESVQNNPELFPPGEYVIATEKLHGTNVRVGYVDIDGEPTLVCGSHTNRRKLGLGSIYELPLKDMGVEQLLKWFGPNTVLFGELFGSKIQGSAFSYGSPQHPMFAAFDLWHNGVFVTDEDLSRYCREYDIPRVPVVYRGSWDPDAIKPLTNGVSTIDPGTVREGVVIRPEREQVDGSVGRVILKWKGDDFLLNKHSN